MELSMISIELTLIFFVLISILAVCAHLVRFYRLNIIYYDQTKSLDDRKQIDFPMRLICIGALVVVCFTIIYGRVV